MIVVGTILDDYTIIEYLGHNDYNDKIFKLKCNICGHTKICSYNNLVRQHNYHSYTSCKEHYVKSLIGKIYDDYKIIGYHYKNDKECVLQAQCMVCKHVKEVPIYGLKYSSFKHSPSVCNNDYYNNEIGKVYGDYKIISINHKTINNIYYNVQCIVCNTKGVKTLSSLTKYKFKHGTECFRMLEGDYKEYFESRFNNMIQRCTNPNNTNYKHYGAKGIKVCYNSIIDFYLDYINEFKNYVKIHGVKNTTFDRINVNGNYEKGNIRMATQNIQSVNTIRKIYFILEKDGVFVLSDSAMEFGRVYNINGRAIGNLVRKKSKTSNGWRLVCKSKDINDLDLSNVTKRIIVS